MVLSRGWAFPINYAEAIAEDERDVAALSSPEAIAVSLEIDKHPEWDMWMGGQSACGFVMAEKTGVRERARAVGITDPTDLSCFLLYLTDGDNDSEYEGSFPLDFDKDAPGLYGTSYRRGEAIAKRVERIPTYSTADRKKLLAQARARLSRHKRNQAKYGK